MNFLENILRLILRPEVNNVGQSNCKTIIFFLVQHNFIIETDLN